jgi:hypothetical protein
LQTTKCWIRPESNYKFRVTEFSVWTRGEEYLAPVAGWRAIAGGWGGNTACTATPPERNMITQRGVGISVVGSLNPGGKTLHGVCQR